jgi:hypothetical protein
MADFFQWPTLKSCLYVNVSVGEWGFSPLEHPEITIPRRSSDRFQRSVSDNKVTVITQVLINDFNTDLI